MGGWEDFGCFYCFGNALDGLGLGGVWDRAAWDGLI